MPELKTVPTDRSVADFLNAVEDPSRRADCFALVQLMQSVTGQPPRLWGDSIVGFGQYHYKYASGHQGDSCVVGFSPRKNNLTLYLVGMYLHGMAERRPDLLDRLGKHKAGKGCLYIQRLSDVDPAVLRELIAASAAEVERVYPSAPE